MASTWLRLGLFSLGLLLGGCSSAPPTTTTSPVVPLSAEADEQAAAAVLSAYMAEVTRGDFDRAWARLSPMTQQAFGSKHEFAAERMAFAQATGGDYRLARPTHDLVLLDQWLGPELDPGRPSLTRAYLAQVDYPRLANNNAGWEILVAAPDLSTGEWHVWKAR